MRQSYPYLGAKVPQFQILSSRYLTSLDFAGEAFATNPDAQDTT